jgi:tRNA-intron endonuclease, archaea type
MSKKKEEGASDQKPIKKKNKVKAVFSGDRVVTENTDPAREFYNQSRYGTVLEDKRIELSLHEAYYLLQKEKIRIVDAKGKTLKKEDFLKKAIKLERNFWTKFCVFHDIRNRGYIIKTALKFGADFRVYDRGIKPGEDHAKWIVYPVKETEVMTWYEFAAKNRVAHSTKKRLLIGIVDHEGDVTYYEIRWVRP